MKKPIRITQSQLRNIVTEVVSNLQEQHNIKKAEEITGYAKLTKQDTDLEVDVFVPLKKSENTILIRNGYASEKEYIPMTIGKHAKLLQDGIDVKVRMDYLFSVADFMHSNIALINALRNNEIGLNYFKNHLSKNILLSSVNASGKKSKLPKAYKIEDPEETMEYALIWPKDSGLKVDVFADDGGSFLRNNHQLILLARNGYDISIKEFIPILVSNHPQIVDKDININISHDELIQILEFIKINRKLLIAMAKCKISSSDFSKYMKKVTLKENLLKDYRTLRMHETGLPTDIWIDETETFQGHAPRIKFKASEEQRTTRQFSSMLITDPSHIENLPSTTFLSAKQIRKLQQFVLNNQELLLRLARKEIDYDHGFAPNVKY